MLISAFAISIGASAGALLRWMLGLWLNPMLAQVPLGTLAANLLGGYLVGIAAAFFTHLPHLPPEWRLLVVTGFLGGLTTFSTFSAEVVGLLQREHLAWGMATAAAHLFGSLALTVLGMATFAWLAR